MIKTFLRYALYFFTAALLLLAGLFFYGRQQQATPEQSAALAELRKKPTFTESENLAPYLWLINYYVPADKINEITAADAEKYNALTSTKSIMEFQSLAASTYPKLDFSMEEFAGYCQFKKGQSCLDEVNKNKEKISEILKKSTGEIAHIEKITNYRSHYSPFEMHMVGALPSVSAGESMMRVQRAMLFLEGEENAAIEKVCGDIAAFRSIGTNSDTLVISMVSQAYVRNRLSLLADMLIRTDSTASLPQACSLALEPIVVEENMLCNAMRGEFKLVENFDVWLSDNTAENVSSADRVKQRTANFFYDHQRTIELSAPRYAVLCSREAQIAASKNTVFNVSEVLDTQGSICKLPERVSNAYGCQFLDVAMASYESYLSRKLDQSAQITAMQTLLWLRDQKATSATLSETFAARPEAMKLFSERIALDRDAGVIKLNLVGRGLDGEETWSLPLLPSMFAR